MAVDFLKIKADYLKNPELSLEKAAVKHGVNPSYLKYVASKDGWAKLKEEVQRKADEKLTEALPETIANIKLRHARVGRNLQAIGMKALVGDLAKGEKALRPSSASEAINAAVKGVNIERQALGLNDKEVLDEVYQKFSQFTFIFNLNGPELQNFIKSAFSRGGLALGAPGEPVSPTDGEGQGEPRLESPAVSG